MSFTAPLLTSFEVRAAAGEPVASVQVRNLQSVVHGPKDAWGRPNKPQPVLVSAELSFAEPFGAAASADNVTSGDTVHYGTLSKALLAGLDRHRVAATAEGAGPYVQALSGVHRSLWDDLTGQTLNGFPTKGKEPFLDLSKLRFLSLMVSLPKASLLGEGVSLTGSWCLGKKENGEVRIDGYAHCLRLHKLRVPTLIGVNDNERQARQLVITDVEIDRYVELPLPFLVDDIYTVVEELVVTRMGKSSFETLEALGADLCTTIIRHLGTIDMYNPLRPDRHWSVKVSMEKPTAVPLADCPIVQVRASSKLLYDLPPKAPVTPQASAP
ncbi:hypothetical protein NKR23_g7331 [Pleurostoma richardsiae]|uniref:Dihydroneopterin aldolase/epimerase domain-containing protein n=1 Tax=Pleurostoma richardsiae TaxID=41990 RepID=A0AA38RBH8_9PEZI|nr:hypothetical protein NKR23_g7331 [Pleurostoma richardsiae]